MPDTDGCLYVKAADGTLVRLSGAAGPPGSGAMPYIVVAAANSAQSWKDSAGYVCDGTDDHVQIQAAMVAASGAAGTSGTLVGNAVVLLAPGTFYTTQPVQVASRVWLRGSGRGATMIRAAAGHTAIGSSTSGVVVIEDTVAEPYDLRHVSDLTIHGGGLDLTGFYSRFQQSAAEKDDNNVAGQPDSASVLERILIAACGRQGVHISFVQASTSWWIDKVRVWSCGDSGDYSGFYIAGTDCWVSNCDVGSQGAPGATAIGFECAGSDNFYTNCIAWVTKGIGFKVTGAKQMLSNCLAHHSEQHGFWITNNRNTLSNCISYNNADDGFRLESNNITLVGCQSFDDNDSFAVTGRPQTNGYNLVSAGTTAGINIVGCTSFGVGMVPVSGTKLNDPTNNIQVTHTGDNQNGSAGTRTVVSYRDGVYDGSGTGAPEGVVAAPVGSIYRRKDGNVGSSLYIKEIGTGTSGWSAITTAGIGGGGEILLSNTGEGGTNGAAISAANSGGTSGSAFSAVSSAGGAPTYSTVSPIKGLVSFQTAASGTSSSSVYWSSASVPSADTYYARFYIKMAAIPTDASAMIFYSKTADAGTQSFRVALNPTDGRVRVGTTGGLLVTGVTPLSAATVYRIEIMLKPVTGEIEARVFVGNSVAPIDAVSTTGPAPGAVRFMEFGRVPTNSGTFSMAFDDIAVGTASWIGPST